MKNTCSPLFINYWYKKNKGVLNYLFYKLIEISKTNGITIKDTDNSFNNFIDMMYHQSDKEIIDKNMYPEIYCKKYNNETLDEYIILN